MVERRDGSPAKAPFPIPRASTMSKPVVEPSADSEIVMQALGPEVSPPRHPSMPSLISTRSTAHAPFGGARTPAWPGLFDGTGPVPHGELPHETPAKPLDEVALHRARNLPGIELWSIRQSSRMWTILQSSYTFGVVERFGGELHWRGPEGTAPLTPTTTLLVEPGELQASAQINAPCDLDLILVAPETVQREFDRDLSDEQRTHRFASHRLEDLGLVGHFRRLWQALSDPQANPVEQQSLLRTYLHAVFDRAGSRSQPSQATRCEKALEQIRTMINTRHQERLTLDAFALETGFSKFYLERSFHERFGLPIHQYLKKVRVSRALDMLRKGIRPSVVSTKVGFADQPHMTRVFRDELGITPRKFFTAVNAT